MAKKLWEILEEEEEKNKEERVEAVQKANEQFDEYVSKKGTYDTSKHTTSMNNIIKAKKNVSKESADNFKKVNKINLGDTASSVGKNVDNLWRGLNNGIYSFRQQLERVTKDNPTNRVLTEQNNFLQEQLNKNPNDEKAKALLNNYNSFQSKLNNESEEYQNKLQEKINQNSDIITKNIDSIDNPILKKTAELAPSIGQMLPGMLPGAGPVYFAGSATGNYYTDAMNRGMSEEEAKVYSGTMGLIEGALESIGAGLTKNVGKQLLKKNIKGALINYGLDIGENFLEESIVEPISELAAQIYGGKDKADWQNIGQRMIDSGIDGALVSAITGGVSGAIGAVGSKIPKQSIYIDYNTNQKLDNKTQNILKQAENIINQNSLPVQNEQYRYTDPQLNQILNNKELPMQSYQYEKSANVKINNLRQDANKYFNNTEKARNYVNMLEKIITDKNIDIRLDANLKTVDGRIANGSYSNGVITINPNSTRTGEFIAIHELTHAIGTKDMLDMVNRYRESNAEFNSAVENLLQSYNTTELTEEALSDVSAQLFGNQEFINNIAQNNPNIFQKLYSEIKYLWHQFRGYKNQDQFVEDLYYKWTQAYNSSNKLNETSNYYIETIEDFDEIKYNNAKELKLPKREYAILSGIVNSDSNIKPGINYVETTNATYEVYFKETGEFKVVGKIVDGGYNDTITNGNIQGTGNTGNAESRMQVHSSTIQQSRTGTRNDEISNFNQKRTRISDTSIGNGSSNSSNVKYSIQESENNSGSFFNSEDFKKYILPEIKERYQYENKNKITETIEELKKRKETLDIDTDEGWDNNFIINQKIKALENGYDTIYDYLIEHDINELKKDYKYNPKILTDKINRVKQTEKKQEKLQKEIEEATPIKRAQYEIIQKTNPMFDDEHVGIRSPADIKTFEEAIQDDESFSWGDYTKEDAERDLKRNKVKIYSSYAIKNGVFVSTSYQQALDYAGGDRAQVHSKEISPNRVAWINGDEGQYASINAKYFIENQTWQSYLDKNYKATGTRTNLQDVKLPTAQKQVAPTAKNNILSTGEYTKQNGINQSNIETNSDLPISENQKFRKHYKSIIQSQYTTDEAKTISKELMKTDTYVPESNNKQLERADKRIELSGADSELSSLMSRSMTGGNIKADDIAVGERLIQYYSKTGNKAKLQEAIQATAMAGTTAGQTVQAMSLLNHQTPEGQAIWLQRSVDKMNNDLVKIRGENVDQFTLTPEMTEKIVNSKNTEELQNNLNEVYEELGQQVTKTNLQKIDAWRYFSMLANPRTHIRNIVGNTAMSGMQYGIKNKIAGSIESVVSKINPEMERTHTIVPASKEVKQFAKNDIKNVADRLGLNENKYNPKTRLENSMRTFKSDAMENTFGKLFELNDKALEAEDGWGLKAGYTKALSEYMTANKLTPENITDKQLAKARNYAIEQAQEATFHQTSALSTLLNQFSNKNKVTKFIMDSTLPFKKTPINVAKSGLEYSPIGLAKSAIYDTIELRKGNISVNKYIDNISKGLTGTGIALVGYALANAGILKASGSDDKDKESFDQDRGNQTYSIQIGDNTYSLDWLAPSGIPLFIGAECFEIMQTDKETKTSSSDEDSSYNQAIKSATNILDAFTNAMNPMTEMSMLSGLTSALKSYDGDNSRMLANLGVNAVKSYINQFVPTALGQVAKTTDEYERSTTSTKTGTLPKAIDSTKNYAMSKIPGLRQMLPTKTDIWGNELKQSNNVLQRGLENSVFPWTRKGLTTTDVDKELNNVYKNTGESSVLPDSINKNLTIDKQKYIMTSEEYAKYKKTYGTTSYNLLNSLVKSNNYKNMSDSQKQYAIEKVYDYATEQIKVDYAKNNKLEYEESKLSKTINAMKKSNANTSNYFEYLALTEDTTKNSEKIKVLTNSSFSNKSKELIYENNLLSDTDEKYPIIKSTGLNINSYLKYKLAESNGEFSSDKKDDGTLKGKTISNSAKNKRYNYINSISGATYTQKLILFALEYEPSSNTDKQQVINYVKTLKGKTDKEKLDILSNFKGITLYKDGTFKY